MITPIYNMAFSPAPKPSANFSGGSLWLKRLDQVIEDNLDNLALDNKMMARELWISERQLFRKVKEITGSSPKKYLRKFRLRIALNYLETGKYRTVKEVSYSVGYGKASYFVNQFEKEFNRRPYQILKNFGWR